MCHARKERVLMIGTDQRITSGPAARTAASRGRIHGCTRIVSRKVRFFSLAPRAPSIHGTKGRSVGFSKSLANEGKRTLSQAMLPYSSDKFQLVINVKTARCFSLYRRREVPHVRIQSEVSA